MGKKYLVVSSLIIVMAISISMLPRFGMAQTADSIQAQINALMQQIQQLQTQLSQVQGGGTTQWCHTFNTNLKVGDQGNEVLALHKALVKEGLLTDYYASESFEGSTGFNENTASAVTGFQQKYKSEILTPNGLSYGTGYVGPSTRKKLNQLYGCGIVKPPCLPYPQPICKEGEKIVCSTGLDEKGCFFPCKCVPPTSCAQPACQVGYTSYDTGEKDSNGCPIKKCIPSTGNQPPVISGVSGPTTLKVNETGTWTIKASDPENGILSYYAVWGDEVSRGLSASAPTYGGATYGQTATFTHSYAWAGVYYPTFQVTDNSGLSAKTSISVNIGDTTITPSITVLSPNGGETWAKGITQTIKWQDNAPVPTCTTPTPPSGISSTCIGNTPLYDINLATYSPSCPAGMVCATDVSAIYKIAQHVANNYYNWTVGAIQGLYDALAPNGLYTIQVCRWGTNTCDSSDSYFKITSGTIQPSITVLSPNGGEQIERGKTYTISWQSTGADKFDILLDKRLETSTQNDYSINPIAYGVSGNQYNWTVPSSLDASGYEGQYKIIVRKACSTPVYLCNDSNLIADNSNDWFSIVAAVTPSITVLSPNGGESWQESPKITDTISGYEAYRQDIKWIGAPDDFNSINNGTVKAYLEKFVNGQYTIIGRIPPFAYGSIAWVVGVVSQASCGPINGVDSNGCFNSNNMFLVPPGQYYVRLTNTLTGAWDRSDAPFSIVAAATNLPDIQITDISPISAVQGVFTTYTATVKNNSSQNITTPFAVNLGGTATTISSSSLAAWQTTTVNASFGLSILGSNQVCARADIWNAVAESDESNNDFCKTVNVVAAAQPSITVLSPNGGEQLTAGTSYTVKWNSTNLGTLNINIDLLDTTGHSIRITSNVSNIGYYNWSIASSIAGGYISGAKYKISISTNDAGASAVDTSDAPFSIAAATASSCTDSDGGQNPNVAGFTDGRVNGLGSYFYDTSVASNGGTCSGDSCTSVAEGYCTTDGKVANILMSCSSGYSVNGACTQKITTPSITVLSPNGGETWQVGSIQKISWQTNNIFSPNDKITIYIAPNDDLSKNISIAQQISNTGSYDYTVRDPSEFNYRSLLFKSGNQFKIFVCAQLAGNIDLCSYTRDYSDAPFSIVAAIPITCITDIMCISGYTGYNTGMKNSNGCPILTCVPITRPTSTSTPSSLENNETQMANILDAIQAALNQISDEIKQLIR